METQHVRTHYLDTSAIVKLFLDEPGSDALRGYLKDHAVFSTTSLCFAETLGVLKAKYVRAIICQEQYLSACEELMAHLRSQSLTVDDIDISDRGTFDNVERLAKTYCLDVADAFQLVSLRHGMYSKLSGESKPLLITADRLLADAAKQEGLRVWNCLDESAP